ncbi:hypothetical protein NQ315_016018 [Exocentrus adspersus]|uniref:Uncharacterized protein n=1 Tax=Exocentrus adspersus TaxID=1586481 RepID=A0AAV8VLC0_9CUCU|nr:hypothetical protein NQ315_016018 [Exocentrus adspersus]
MSDNGDTNLNNLNIPNPTQACTGIVSDAENNPVNDKIAGATETGEAEGLDRVVNLKKQNMLEPETSTDQNLHTSCQNIQQEVEASTKPAILGESDIKCDIYSAVDVENATDSFKEKTKGAVNAEATTSTDALVHKVKELDIHGAVRRNESAVVINKQTDSLKNLMAYESSSEDEYEVEANSESKTDDKTASESESSSDSDDSVSDSELDSDDCLTESDLSSDEDENVAGCKTPVISKDQPKAPEDATLKIYTENTADDLPPIKDVSNLDIDVEKEEFLHMGHIEAIIGNLITVEALPGIPAYDLDTCLFIEDKAVKKPFGAVYDVIGPVAAPVYCVRFQSITDVANFNLVRGMKVFCAPKSKHTKYVFVRELMKIKGSDASWVGDVELPPEIAAQLSDDECPSETQEPRKPLKRRHDSQERHKRFEETMNRCNTLKSRTARLIDSRRHVPRMTQFDHYSDPVQTALLNDMSRRDMRLPPTLLFDPTVPPPGFYNFYRNEAAGNSMPGERQQPMTPQRTTRCHAIFRQRQDYHLNGNYNGEQGPGSSFLPD